MAEALARQRSDEDGLTAAEAGERLAKYGRNALEVTKPASAWRILVRQLRSVVVLLLCVAAGIAWWIGDPPEAMAIGAVLVINTLLGFVTELRARRAMEALLGLDVPRARVLRDGEAHTIDAQTLVPGDVILIEAGEAVPADARLIDAVELQVNESALTGESLPVSKDAGAVLGGDTPLAERINMVYKATTVTTGTGRALVVGTGMRTEVGRIGELVGGIVEERTPLERRLDALGARLIWVTIGVVAAVMALGRMRGIPLLDLAHTGIALAIAAIPEGLPAVATIALAVGVRRMARRNALVRRLPAVESLGSATIVCTDKTGTLTGGQMTVVALRTGDRAIDVTGGGYAPDGTFKEGEHPVDPRADPTIEFALRIGALANHAGLVEENGVWQAEGDPTEAALLVAARKGGFDPQRLQEEWPKVDEIPFSSERKLMATIHRPASGTVAYVKGAPGRLIELSSAWISKDGERPLDEGGRRHLREVNDELAGRGLRVLALAYRDLPEGTGVELTDLVFVALAGIADPPAEGVKETVALFRKAGIRTVMITGDQRRTAESVGRELAILGPGDETLDGSELERMPEQERASRLERVAAFSRVSPEQKLKIVSALQKKGEIVAMLGDGVNDAAALKKADIGVAMGRRGTDVAKEVAAVVLQDDRFATIGAAIEEGRIIFDNIRKFVLYLFSCNVAEVLVIFVAIVAGLPAPLLPLQILWLNLVTDTFPALSLAAEPGEPNVMTRPPRDPDAAILSWSFLRAIVFYACLITAATLGAFVWALRREPDAPTHATTVAFMTLALAQTFHLGNARGPRPLVSLRALLANRWALAALGVTVALQLATVYTPLAGVLEVERLDLSDWTVILPLAFGPLIIGQAAKLVRGARVARHLQRTNG